MTDSACVIMALISGPGGASGVAVCITAASSVAAGVGVEFRSKAMAVASFSGIGVGEAVSRDNRLLLQDIRVKARMNSHTVRLMMSPDASGKIRMVYRHRITIPDAFSVPGFV
jgi:hypothetical protein